MRSRARNAGEHEFAAKPARAVLRIDIDVTKPPDILVLLIGITANATEADKPLFVPSNEQAFARTVKTETPIKPFGFEPEQEFVPFQARRIGQCAKS